MNPPRRDEVWLVSLDPTQGSEIQKSRPCLVVSPNEANEYLHTVIIAPMTTTERSYPTRVSIQVPTPTRPSGARSDPGGGPATPGSQTRHSASKDRASRLFGVGGDVHPLDAPFRPGAMAASRGARAFVLPQRWPCRQPDDPRMPRDGDLTRSGGLFASLAAPNSILRAVA